MAKRKSGQSSGTHRAASGPKTGPKIGGQSGLKSADAALWDAFTETISPLKGRTPAHIPRVSAPRQAITRLSHDHHSLLAPAHAASLGPATVPATLDKRSHKAIARGKQAIDRRLDLHGETQDSAFAKLRAAIFSAYSRGERVVLVVTGKGGARYAQRGGEGSAAYRTRADFDLHGGVLKRMVPVWLTSTELAGLVSGYGTADPAHGGAGALYVRIRRRR